MKILALDTATERCSAALLSEELLLARELDPGPVHSEHILGLVQALLAEAAIVLNDLDCIAFGRGPGGFTGVRLAASITQGLAFGAGLPVVPVSDLMAVAQQALDLAPDAASILVCNDARMREVYWGCATRGRDGLASAAGPEQVGAAEIVQLPLELQRPLHGAGRGFLLWPSIQERLARQLSSVQPHLLPRASEIARLAVPEYLAGQAVAADQALPVYLRNNVAKPSRK